LRRGFQKLPQTAGVVAVRVRDPQPPHVGRIEHLGKSGDEILVSGAETAVDNHGLLGVQDKGVDGKEPEARNLDVVIEDRDIPDPVDVHSAPSLHRSDRPTRVCSPRGW
jgi:hypothetical protein